MNQLVNPSSRYYDPIMALNQYLDEKNAFNLIYNEDKNMYSLPYLYAEYKNNIEPIGLSKKIMGSIKKFLADNLYSKEEVRLILSHLTPDVNKYGYETIAYLEKSIKRMSELSELTKNSNYKEMDVVNYIRPLAKVMLN